MASPTPHYRDEVMAELDALPDEYLPLLLRIVRTFRESITLKPADQSFREGWRDAKEGNTFSVSTLWDDIDAE